MTMRDEMIAAYMQFCKNRAPDHNEVGGPYFFAAFEAAYAAGQRAAWQPIGSAPQNERETVLVSDGYSVGEAFWHDGSQCYGHRGKAGWFWEADRDSLLTASNAHVTHWMPLPPPSPLSAAIRNRKEQG